MKNIKVDYSTLQGIESAIGDIQAGGTPETGISIRGFARFYEVGKTKAERLVKELVKKCLWESFVAPGPSGPLTYYRIKKGK